LEHLALLSPLQSSQTLDRSASRFAAVNITLDFAFDTVRLKLPAIDDSSVKQDDLAITDDAVLAQVTTDGLAHGGADVLLPVQRMTLRRFPMSWLPHFKSLSRRQQKARDRR
jgi:hypothetical protein